MLYCRGACHRESRTDSPRAQARIRKAHNMTRMSISLVGTVLGLSLLGPAAARADLITWSFNWSGSPTTVPADAGGTGGGFFLDPQPGHGQRSLEIKGAQLPLFLTAAARMPYKLTH